MGTYIPSAHWTPNPANAPFARELREAQRFVRAGWLDNAPNARCVPVCWLPTFAHKARYANPTSHRSEIEGWMASIQRVCAWLNAAGRAEQRLLCVGDGRGDTQALGTLDVPPHGLLGAHAPRLARVRLAAGCAFRSGASAGVERPSVDTARQVATVQGLATGAACGARA